MDGLQSEARPRGDDRVPIEVRVRRFGTLSHEYQSVNLSEGGVFVATGETLPPGTWVELAVQLGGRLSTTEIVSSAQVMWSNDPRTPSSTDLPAGMGLRFVGLDPGSQEALRAYVGELRASREKARQTTIQRPGPKRRRSNKRRAELLSPGDRLGAYRIHDVLGIGGMGTVYLAEQVRICKSVALKKLHRRFTSDRVAAQRFFDEARLVNHIGHPNIVEVFDFVCEGRDHYFVMELLDGRPLGAVIADDAPLSTERIVSIAAQLCDVLGAVHARNVIHRDLKPDNVVLIERGGNPDFVKLLDFGIAKLRAPVENLNPAHTAAGIVLGTPGFLAPEAIAGRPVDARCDIYALGMVLFLLATGRMPFSGGWGQVVVKQATETPPCPNTFRSHPLPAAIDALILRCLASDPNLRPQSMAELQSELVAANAPPPRREDDRPEPRRRPRLLLGAALVFGLAVGATVNMLVPGERTAPRVSRPRAQATPRVRTLAPTPPVPTATPGPKRSATSTRQAEKRRMAARDHYRRGKRFLERGDARLAATELERAVRLRPRHSRSHRALGKAYLLLGREADGFAALTRYVELAPDAPDSPRLRELIAAFGAAH